METSPSIAEITKALCNVQSEIKGALKDSNNPFFKTKYADLASVWDACRDQLHKYGLAVFQSINGDSTGVIVTTMLAHVSGEWVRDSSRTEPKDMTPQSVGSATTYLRRYGLAAIVGVVQVDDDAESSQPAQRPRSTARNSRDPKSSSRESSSGDDYSHAEEIPIDPPRSRPPDDDGKPKKWVAPAKGWWDESCDGKGGPSWKHMAEHYPETLVDIAVAAGKRCGKRPTEEDWNGWTQREISALRSLERFNVRPLEEARAALAAQRKAPDALAEPPIEVVDAPVETNDPSSWAVGWDKCWCGFGPDPEATFAQVVNEQAAFVRDHLKKLKVQQPDMKQWAVRDAKLLTAVRLFNATLLQK